MKNRISFLSLGLVLAALSMYAIGCGSSPTGGGSSGTAASWHFITVESYGSGSSNIPNNTSLAFDNNGNPSIAYFVGNITNIKYATIDAATKTVRTSTVDASSNSDGVALVFNSSSVPYIAFNSGGNLTMASMDATGTWISRTVDPGASLGKGISIGKDSGDNIYISYSDLTGASVTSMLKLAQISGGAITLFEIKNDNEAQYSSLVMRNDHPAIAYADTFSSPGAVGYITTESLVFITSEVSSTVYDPQGISLKVDSLGRPKVAYVDDGYLMYAEWNSTSGQWDGTGSPIDTGLSNVNYLSLVLTSTRNPMIAFRDEDTGTLKLATRSGSIWTVKTVDSSVNVGEYCSLVLDSKGRPCISYMDRTNNSVKYAYWR
jgi:hypothetical protein